LANTGNYSSKDLWVTRLMGLEHALLNLLCEMFPCVDSGISVRDVAVVPNKGVVTSPKYARWIVMDVRSQRRNTHAHKLTSCTVISKNLWSENYYK
jgi:hypothetical protein